MSTGFLIGFNMARSSYMRFRHRCEILSKTVKTNDTGQKMPSWSVVYAEHKCFATPSSMRASIRVSPTIEQGDYLTFYVSPDTNLDFSTRVRNIRYRSDIIYAGPYEVQDVKPMTGFSGAVQHQEVLLKKVVE